jgi:arylsulfatase A-like enzyme
MDKRISFKKSIWMGISASCLTSACVLLLVLIFFRPHNILDKLQPEGLSFLDSVIIGNYLFLFVSLVFLFPALFISFIIRKPLKIFQAQLFLFWVLISLSFASFIYSEKIAKAASRNLLLPLFCILLPAAIILIYNRVYKTKNLQRLILATAAGAIIISASGFLFNFKEWLLPFLIKRDILLGLNVLAIVVLTTILGWSSLYRLSLWIVNKIIYFTGKDRISVYIKLLVILLIASCSIAILGYLWEEREVYKYVASRTAKNTNVILIISDALRPDHLGCYGYGRETSPVMDSLAKEGVLFKHCYSATPYTKSSVASILTSLYQSMHGMILERHVLPESLTTLADILRENGYVTSAYVANPLILAKYNYDQGFDFFQDNRLPGEGKLYYIAFEFLDSIVFKFMSLVKKDFRRPPIDKKKSDNIKVISWLAKFRRQNFFMYIHYIDPHYPYSPPEPYDKMFPYPAGDKKLEWISLYDGEIRFVNEYLGEFFERLKSWQIYDNTLIIITADHGEAFGEHNFYDHANTLYQEEIKVPLIIKFDHSLPQGKVIESQVKSIDIMPTILDVLDISYSGDMEGKSLLPLIKNDKEDKSRDYIFVEKDNVDPFEKAIIKNNEWKLIFAGDKSASKDIMRKGHLELYNLKADPGESRNLVTQEQEILKEMSGVLEGYIKYCEAKAGAPPVEIKSDKATTRRLRSLGYAQ